MARKARHRISYVLPLPDSAGGHHLGVNGLAIDHEQAVLYSGGRDGLICTWSLNADRSQVDETSFGPKTWAAGDDRPPNPSSGHLTSCRAKIRAHTHWINDIVLTPDRSVLVSASSDLTVKAWRPYTEEQAPPKTVGVHTDYVKCLATSGSHAHWVASGGLDRRVCIWDLNGGGQALEMNVTGEEGSAKGSVYALGVGGSILASGGPESIVRVWDLKSGRRVTNFVGHTDNVRDILVSDHGDLIMTASSDQTVKLWSLTAGRCMHTLTMHNESVWSLHSDHPRLSVFYSSDRSGLVAKTTFLGRAEVDEGLCVAVCKEHGGVNKVLGDGSSVWTATSKSAINRWADHDSVSMYPVEAASTRRHQFSSPTWRLKGGSSARSSQTPTSTAHPRNQITFKNVLQLSNTASFPSPHMFGERIPSIQSAQGWENGSEAEANVDLDGVIPLRSLPEETFEGRNGLIKHIMLNDRRRVLTLDTAGEVMMWDLITCELIQSYGKRHLDEVAATVNTVETTPNWCTVDTRTGQLACVLEGQNCFDGEVYADELPITEGLDFKEDQRINIGKWVLRYLFSALIDEETKRDSAFRNTPASAQSPELTRLQLTEAPSSIQLPSQTVVGWHTSAPSTPGLTPRPVNGFHAPITPGLAIGAATPAPQPRTGTHGEHQLRPFDNGSVLQKRSSQHSLSRSSSEKTGDYFSTIPSPPVRRDTSKMQFDSGDTDEERLGQASVEPEKENQGKESASLFGKKFRIPFSGKKLGWTTSADPVKPVVADEKADDSDDSKSAESGAAIEDNFFGVVQKIRQGQSAWPQNSSGPPAATHITPSQPAETPLLKIPPSTAIIIQEDHPDSGGVADLYCGTVASIGEDADLVEKAAPMWLGDLLLLNQIPYKEVVKISFVLQPYENLLPSIASPDGNVRLNANRMLRVRKILAYVIEKLDLSPRQSDQTLTKPEEYLDLYCQNQPIHPKVTLATIRTYIWKGGGDVMLYYKAKEGSRR